jgi:hypothetical protein
VLAAKVIMGKNLRKPAAWFEKDEVGSDEDTEAAGGTGNMLKKRPQVVAFDADKAKVQWFAKTDFKVEAASASAASGGAVLNKHQSVSGDKGWPESLLKEGPAMSPGRNDAEDNKSVTSRASKATLSASTLAMKQGKDSAVKLHTNQDLQRAEERRAGALQALKKNRASHAAAESTELEKTSTLRKIEPGVSKVDRKDISKDEAAMRFLNKNIPRVLALKAERDGFKAETALLPRRQQDPVSTLAALATDMWDEVIDRVITISECRAPNASSSSLRLLMDVRHSRGLSGESIEAITSNRDAASNLPTPTPIGKATPTAFKKGTASTSKKKGAPGTASVTTARSKLGAVPEAGVSTVSAAAAKMGSIQEDEYTQVYRRLVSMPLLSANEYEGDRERHSTDSLTSGSSHLVAFASKLFSKFDKNLNGLITLEEFKTSLHEMNVNVNEEDTQTLFTRFETSKKDGTIDWEEFLAFFHTHIVGDQFNESMGAVLESDGGSSSSSSNRPMTVVLKAIWKKIRPVIAIMESNRWSTLDDYLRQGGCSSNNYNNRQAATPRADAAAVASAEGADAAPAFEIPCNAIFHRLNTAHTSRNLASMRQLGVVISETEMKRVNRVFSRSVRIMLYYSSSFLFLFVMSLSPSFSSVAACSHSLAPPHGTSLTITHPPSINRHHTHLLLTGTPIHDFSAEIHYAYTRY